MPPRSGLLVMPEPRYITLYLGNTGKAYIRRFGSMPSQELDPLRLNLRVIFSSFSQFYLTVVLE